jgi:hypothetical protein
MTPARILALTEKPAWPWVADMCLPDMGYSARGPENTDTLEDA